MSEIDLNFGPESVEPSTFEPFTEGMYDLLITDVQVSQTKGKALTPSGEIMLTLELTVSDELNPVPQYDSNKPVRAGRKVFDRWVIPGKERKENEPDKWHNMMNMLRDKLEAVYREPWREDDMKLDPRDLSGRMVRGAVVIEPYTDNSGVTQLSNKVKKYVAVEGDDIGNPSSAPASASSFKL